MPSQPKTHLTVSELAREMHVSVSTAREWCREGRVEAERTLGGHYRIPRAELTRLRPPHADAHRAA